MRSSKNYAPRVVKKVEEPKILVEEKKEEIFPVEEKISTKRKNKKTLLEIMEEEE